MTFACKTLALSGKNDPLSLSIRIVRIQLLSTHLRPQISVPDEILGNLFDVITRSPSSRVNCPSSQRQVGCDLSQTSALYAAPPLPPSQGFVLHVCCSMVLFDQRRPLLSKLQFILWPFSFYRVFSLDSYQQYLQ